MAGGREDDEDPGGTGGRRDRGEAPDDREARDDRDDRDDPDGQGGTLRVSRSLAIPLHEITWRATTPGGPGGQHANRTASKVEVRFDVERSASLGPRQRALLLERLGAVVTASSGDERSQARNRQLALERLAERIGASLRVRRARRPTAPTAAARARRLDSKRRRSITKKGRRAPSDEE